MKRLNIQNLYFSTHGPISFSLEEGECVGLTGTSGIGKTLLLRAIADMDRYRGTIFLDGEASSNMSGPNWRKNVGLLPSESSWWFDTVGEHFKHLDKKAFHLLGFEYGAAHWDPGRMSSGERQRMALLRLLSYCPKVLLLDEPTANLDDENIKNVEKLILDYRSETDASIIWTAHDREQLKRVTDRCFLFTETGLSVL